MKKSLCFVAFFLILQLLYGQTYHPTYFHRQELIDDIQFFKEKTVNVHPVFTDPEKQKRWEYLCDSIISNRSDSTLATQFFLEISELLARINDGHTTFLFPYTERMNYMKNGGVTIPLTVKMNKEKMYIDEYFGEDRTLECKGAEIDSINGKAVSEIVANMRKLYGAERNSIKDKSVADNFGACYWMLYGEFTKYNLVLTKDRKPSTVSIKAVFLDTYFDLKKKYAESTNAPLYNLHFSTGNKAAILKIKSFAQAKTLSDYLQFAFDTIDQLQCKNLVIDIRNNFGGTSYGVDTLINYLTDKSYAQYASIALRTSEEAKNKYKDRSPDLYKLFASYPASGLFHYSDSMLLHTPTLKKHLFNGDLYVLTNSFTYSAAATFAGVIKQYRLGKIVGQPTGEPVRYYADFLQFKLPATALEFVVSVKEFIQYGNNDLNQGVAPDLLFEDDNSTFDEIISVLNLK